MRLDVAIGEEYLFLSLFGDADGTHGHVGLACLYSGYLSGKVHYQEFQLPVAAVGPLCQQVDFQARWFAGVDKVEGRHGRIGGYAHGAPSAALLWNVHSRRIVGFLPAVEYFLIGAVAADFCQETVEVLLQLSIFLVEACANRNRCKSGSYGVNLVSQFLVEYQCEALAACRLVVRRLCLLSLPAHLLVSKARRPQAPTGSA